MTGTAAGQRLFVLKEGNTFLVADTFVDITFEDGQFHNDTRLLSTLPPSLARKPPPSSIER